MIWGNVGPVRAQMMACLSVNVVVPLAVILSDIVTAAGFLIAPEWQFEPSHVAIMWITALAWWAEWLVKCPACAG